MGPYPVGTPWAFAGELGFSNKLVLTQEQQYSSTTALIHSAIQKLRDLVPASDLVDSCENQAERRVREVR